MAGVLKFTYGATVFSIQDIQELGDTAETAMSASRDVTGGKVIQVLAGTSVEPGGSITVTGRLSSQEFQSLKDLRESAQVAQADYCPDGENAQASWQVVVRRVENRRLIPLDWVDVTLVLEIVETL